MVTAALVFTAMPTIEAEAAGVQIDIDGKGVAFTQEAGEPFVDEANRTQVPFRETMEQFGCTVSWNQDTQTATAEKDTIKVEVPIGQKFIYKNSEMISNDTAAIIKDNKTYLPIRAVFQAFGANIRWNESTQTVMVSTGDQSHIMTVHFINVGQADSIFVDYNDFEILIDGGGRSTSLKVVDYIKPYVDGDLDLLIATHEHEDHIGGIPAVLNAYQVDQLIDNGRTATTKIFGDYSTTVQAETNCLYTKVTDKAIDMGNGAQFKVIAMDGIYSDPNENSVISMISYGNVEVLLMGDLETTVEKNNLNKFHDIDVLKVGHHGSRTATSQPFLEVVKPEVSVISAGIDNQYGLPNQDIISRLLQQGSATFGTFRSGDIIMSTDGDTYRFNTDINLTPNDAGAHGSLTLANTTTPAVSYNGELAATPIAEKEACYVGNSSTLKFHTMNCSSGAKIADRNAVYFKVREDASNAGYVPCKICNP